MTPDQRRFVEEWTFRALNVRFKQNHLLDAEEIQRAKAVLRNWEVAQQETQLRSTVEFEDMSCSALGLDIIEKDDSTFASDVTSHSAECHKVSQSTVVVPPSEHLGRDAVSPTCLPADSHVAVLHPDDTRTILSFSDYTELKGICQSLVTMINRNNRLETIMITNLHLEEKGTKQIMRALENKKSLKRVSVGSFKYHAPLTASVTKALCDLLSSNHSIKEVGFKALNPSSDETILQVLRALCAAQIDQLSLHRDPLTDRVGKKIASLVQRGNIKALRLLIFPNQPAEGCTHVFNALAQSDSTDRLLFGGCLKNRNPELERSLAAYLKSTKTLKLLHLIDFADWSDNQHILLNSLTQNKSLFILKLQFASRTPMECHKLLCNLKPALINHPTLVKLTMENAKLNADCYDVLAEIAKHNNRIKVIHLLNVNHSTEDDNSIMNAMVKLREVLMHNETLQNMKITAVDHFLRNTNIMILYYQIIALCAKNAALQRAKQEELKKNEHQQKEENRTLKRKRVQDDTMGVCTTRDMKRPRLHCSQTMQSVGMQTSLDTDRVQSNAPVCDGQATSVIEEDYRYSNDIFGNDDAIVSR
eukprot:CAMPEP_0117448572 /NCGR_PEP_ID=MMETSP0759-20121206/7475_1 /TAXON_ID=63605 /ORGANISM="Percolomonas cosmopolitus, Strain WS" /LENGTH=588 /DNA_ID=CAMNT_0005240973 /DNA_START=492 /DNA_END=2258 /DNA_ORIENTATION=+